MTDPTREQIAWNAGRDAAIRCCVSHEDDDAMDRQAKAECADAIAALQAPQFQPAPPSDVVESIAKLVYEAMRHAAGAHEGREYDWVEGGNSNIQVEARSAATKIMGHPAIEAMRLGVKGE